jgi:catechol 2,3-dioxygenase-like lactoylglutathione lyase family enzyme
MSLTVEALDHLVISVENVDISAEWYQSILGMEREDFTPGKGKSPRVALNFGRQKINLRPICASKEEWFTADHERTGSQDLCFLTQSRPQQVVDHLQARGIDVEVGPVEKYGAQGTLMSVYCRDPDGNLIEISSYVRPFS